MFEVKQEIERLGICMLRGDFFSSFRGLYSTINKHRILNIIAYLKRLRE